MGDGEIAHHGDILFYDAFRVKAENERRVWLEYLPRFTEVGFRCAAQQIGS